MKKNILTSLIGIVFFIIILLMCVNTSFAYEVTVNNIIHGDSGETAQVTFYDNNNDLRKEITAWSDYKLNITGLAGEDGPVTKDAFCIEGMDSGTGSFEHVGLPSNKENLLKGAWVADQYWSSWSSGNSYSKEEAQIAIWELVLDGGSGLDNGKFILRGNENNSGSIDEILDDVESNYDSSSINSQISLIHNPVGGNIGVPEGHQDYLIKHPVPIPAAAWLLVSGFLGFLGLKRKKMI